MHPGLLFKIQDVEIDFWRRWVGYHCTEFLIIESGNGWLWIEQMRLRALQPNVRGAKQNNRLTGKPLEEYPGAEWRGQGGDGWQVSIKEIGETEKLGALPWPREETLYGTPVMEKQVLYKYNKKVTYEKFRKGRSCLMSKECFLERHLPVNQPLNVILPKPFNCSSVPYCGQKIWEGEVCRLLTTQNSGPNNRYNLYKHASSTERWRKI